MDESNFDRSSMLFDKIIINFNNYDWWCDGVLIIPKHINPAAEKEVAGTGPMVQLQGWSRPG